MSATTMTMRDGFFSAIACKRSTHWFARSRSLPALGQAGGDAGQILDQSQPQHDRHGPEFA